MYRTGKIGSLDRRFRRSDSQEENEGRKKKNVFAAPTHSGPGGDHQKVEYSIGKDSTGEKKLKEGLLFLKSRERGLEAELTE